MADGCNVTIWLIRKEQWRTKKRKRKSMEYGSPPLAKIRADSTRLCQCSKYFATWVSQRRTMHTQMEDTLAPDAAEMEFSLQVETEVVHYQDCFSRMYFSFKPISSIAHCIELLKVAAQIDFEEVVEKGVRYLTAAPWSDEDEKVIREFWNSGLLSPYSTCELSARLQLLSNREERQNELLCLTEGVLDQYMRLAISEGSNRKLREESRKMFSEAFHMIVVSSGPGKCRKILQYALDLMREQSEKLLFHVKRSGCQGENPSVAVTQGVSNFVWVFDVVREANAAEEVVVVLLRADDLPMLLRGAFHSITGVSLVRPFMQKKWAKMVYQIFQDVLGGQLLLRGSERLTLFRNWNWLLQGAYLEADEVVVAAVVTKFILSFTHVEQKEIFLRWVRGLDDPQQADYNLSEAHAMWMKRLISEAVKRVPECTPSNWERDPAHWGSSSLRMDEKDMEARWDSILPHGQETTPEPREMSSFSPAPAMESSPSPAAFTSEASPSSIASHEASPHMSPVASGEFSPSPVASGEFSPSPVAAKVSSKAGWA